MIRFEEKKDAAKQVEPARMDPVVSGGRVDRGDNAEGAGFDRTAYQREYMRRWRAKRQKEDR